MRLRGQNRAVRFGALAIALGGAIFVAGCGDDDEASEPATIAIEATGAEGALSYEAPAEAEAGAAEIEFTNSSELDELDAQMVFVPAGEEHTDEEVIAELGKVENGEAVGAWFQGGGGPSATPKGETETVTQELQEGTYYVVGGEDKPKAPLAKIEVSGSDGAELPEADATVSAQEYSYAGEGLKSGESEILLDNVGAEWHHFVTAPIAEGKTIEDVKTFIESDTGGGPPPGPPPFAEEGGFESTVLEGGTSQVITADLKPGKYAFFCFVPDKQGGPPHVAKGMISEVTVEE